MYPREELNLLERRKAILRTRIRLQRIDAGVHLEEVLRPVVWLSTLHAKWKGLPFGLRMVTGPLTFLLQRALVKRLPIRGKMMLWIPLVWKVAKWVLPLMKNKSFGFSRPPSRAAVKTEVKTRRAESGAARESKQA